MTNLCFASRRYGWVPFASKRRRSRSHASASMAISEAGSAWPRLSKIPSPTLISARLTQTNTGSLDLSHHPTPGSPCTTTTKHDWSSEPYPTAGYIVVWRSCRTPKTKYPVGSAAVGRVGTLCASRFTLLMQAGCRGQQLDYELTITDGSFPLQAEPRTMVASPWVVMWRQDAAIPAQEESVEPRSRYSTARERHSSREIGRVESENSAQATVAQGLDLSLSSPASNLAALPCS
jgi:hypothetical protein